MRLDVWQFKHDWVVLFRRLFRWSPGGAGFEVFEGIVFVDCLSEDIKDTGQVSSKTR